MDKIRFKKVLDDAQEILNDAYANEGLTGEILDCQVYINEMRNILNITDDNEKINGDFVQ